jgi:parallel beta-helix repeat protein
MTRKMLITGILIVVAVVLAQPVIAYTSVTGPVVISSPGYYILSNDITTESVNRIIDIRSSDVLFDGMGHTLNGKNGTTQLTNNIFAGGFTYYLHNITVQNVTLKNRSHGIMFSNVTYSRVINCGIFNSGQDGIRVSEGYRNNFTNNTIKNSSIRGITLTASFSNTVSDNTIINNLYGLRISEGAANNIIYNNYFNNSRNLMPVSTVNTWNITKTPGQNIIGGPYLGGNFWSDYAGIDTDNDGIGNTNLPYTSLGNISSGGDRLPLRHVTPPANMIGVFRPSTHTFYLKNVSSTTTINFGSYNYLPVAGDWNRDELFDVGMFRPSTHTFYLKNGSSTTTIDFGSYNDLPVAGDWNHDGFFDVGVFRPSTHTFYLKNGSSTTTINFGSYNDLPVAGDWNSDGLFDVGVFRPSTHTFYLKNGSSTTTINFGSYNDLPVAGDWNSDRISDVGVFRPSTHTFYLKNGSSTTTINFGSYNDLPVSGHWS